MRTIYRNSIYRYIKSYYLQVLFICCFVGVLPSCKKYLSEKPVQSLTVPSTLNDLQKILDNYTAINQASPRMLEVIADNYYVTDANYNPRSELERLNYLWDSQTFDESSWTVPYQAPVYYSNVVLDQIDNIQHGDAEMNTYKAIKGTALFYRSFAFYELAQIFCKPYTSGAKSDPGIVLKLNSNINEKSIRSTVEQTYNQIINDIIQAADLLPSTTVYPTRPNKAAAYGMLARVYLSMRDYINAGKYAAMSLQEYKVLIDYNTITTTVAPVFGIFCKEMTFFNVGPAIPILSNTRAIIDTTLYKSYDNNDLRKKLFFKSNGTGTFGFQGSLEGGALGYLIFDGVATDEIYLIKAECEARAGDKTSAMDDLNALMIKRWKNTVSYPSITAVDNLDALNKVLIERRKELIYRGLRWTDIRRLNLEGANIVQKRIIGGTTYTLQPNDPRYVLLIPQTIINFSGIEQNQR